MSYLSFHFQSNVQGWLDAVAKAKPRVVKIFQIEMGNATKAVSPGTKTVFRHFVSHQQPYLDKAGEGGVQAREAATEFINQFEDSLNRQGGIDYVESLNETYATAAPETMRKAVAFDVAFCERLPFICPGVKPIMFTAAIGNPGHDEYASLLELAAECELFGGALGYHAYHPVYNQHSFVDSASHQKNLHLRWCEIDEFLIAADHRVDWFLGEIGPIGAGPDGYGLLANDGWRHPGVWDNDLSACIADLAVFDRLLTGTRAAREGRLLGGTLFTSGPWDWKHFQWQGAALGGMADYIAANPTPEPPASPPIEPRIVDITDQLTRDSDSENQYKTRPIYGITDHVVHHTATLPSLTPEQCARYHVNVKGWPGIGYAFWIVADGTIYQTNRIETKCFGTAWQNHRYLQTALPGHFCHYAPSQAQLDSLRWLHNVYLPNALGRVLPLIGHKEGVGQATLCPGDKWDWHRLDESWGVEPELGPDPERTQKMRVICSPYLHIRTGATTTSQIVGRLFQGVELWTSSVYSLPGGNEWANFAGSLWAAVRYNGVTLMEVVE